MIHWKKYQDWNTTFSEWVSMW